MSWQNISNAFTELPDGIRVFSGRNKQLPLNVWYVEVNSKSEGISTDIIVSNNADRRETPSKFAERLNAAVVVNGGYFLMHKNPTEHVGLLKVQGTEISTLQSIYFLIR